MCGLLKGTVVLLLFLFFFVVLLDAFCANLFPTVDNCLHTCSFEEADKEQSHILL